jgi:hypothetical protein
MAPCDNSKFLISGLLPLRHAVLERVATKGRHSIFGIRCPFFLMNRAAFFVPIQDVGGF